MEKKKIELRDYQKECIEKIDNAEPGKYLVTLATGLGKCFAKGTEILMYNGEVKKVEDIREGDLVMGWDSTPRKVSGLSRGKEMMYRIERPKHDPYTVNESHVLSLKITGISSSYNKRVTDSLGRKFSRGDICSIKVSDYLKCSDYFKHIAKGFCASVDFKEQKIPVDPYFLGLWLGDGSSRALKITTQDAEVSDYLYDFAEKIGGSVKKSHSGNEGEADDYTISFGYKHTGIRKYFRETLFLNKHIPQEYLSNSEEIRLKLLAGLLDSDGYLHKQDHSTFEYSTRSEKMQKQAAFLCRTLGLTARCFKRFNKKYRLSAISG